MSAPTTTSNPTASIETVACDGCGTPIPADEHHEIWPTDCGLSGWICDTCWQDHEQTCMNPGCLAR